MKLLFATLVAARLGFTGLGPVQIGMTASELRSAAGEIIEDHASDECHYVRVKSQSGIFIMMTKGRVARIDMRDRSHATISGIRLGDSESAVKRAYRGRYTRTPHKYVEKGHYFIIRSSDRKSAMVIETDGRHVTMIRAGKKPEAEWVEGCS